MNRGPRVHHRSYGEGVVLGDPTILQPTVDFGYMSTPVPRGQLQWLDVPDPQPGVRPPSPPRLKNRSRSTRGGPLPPRGSSPTPQSRDTPGVVTPSPQEGGWGHGVVPNSHDPANGLELDEKPLDFPPQVAEARRAILALRLGQVLEENVEHLSVGLDSLHSTLLRSVDEAVSRRPQSLLFEGAWGTGKTHLLTLLTALARKRGMASARVTLDGEGITFAEPMGLLKYMLSSLRYQDEAIPSGLTERLRQVRRQYPPEAVRGRLGRTIGRALLEIPLQAYDDPEVINVLHDYFTLSVPKTRAMEALRHLRYYSSLPALGAWKLSERPRRFRELLSRWAEFCVMTGATGLTIVFDELDVEYAQTMYRKDRQERRRRLLRVLGDLRSWRRPLLIAFGSAPSAGDAADDVASHVEGLIRVRAPTLTLADTWALAEKLRAVYETAYGETTGDATLQIKELANKLSANLNPTHREFVRGLLEILDLASLECSPVPGD